MENWDGNEAHRTIAVCIDSYEQGVPTGYFYHLDREEEVFSFHSLTQFLTGMEHQLNSARRPQSFTRMRSFVPIPEEEMQNGQTLPKARQGTFLVNILFRQHTSWQGTVTWLEGHSKQVFRSVLELILLVDGALGGSPETAQIKAG